MKKLDKFMVAILIGMVHFSARAKLMLNDIAGTSGAGTKDLISLTTKGADTGQAMADFALLIFTLIGIVIFGLSILSLHKASKDDRESPKGAIAGVLVGAAMTCIGVLIGYVRNSFNISG